MTREEKIMQRVREHYSDLEKRIKDSSWECEIFGLFLQGSQNYNLDEYSEEYMSDVDTKAIVIPSLKDLINAKTYSTTLVLENNEHIDLKDIQTMINMFRKQNTSYIELLFTDYYIINPKYEKLFKWLKDNSEDIARLDPATHARALTGSAHNKYKALTHVSPHSEEKIAKFGYDPKELCHLIRYYSELVRYIENKGKSYKEYLLGPSKEVDEYLMRVKKGLEYSAELAIEMANDIDSQMKIECDNFVATNPEKNEKLDKELQDFLYGVIEFRILE